MQAHTRIAIVVALAAMGCGNTVIQAVSPDASAPTDTASPVDATTPTDATSPADVVTPVDRPVITDAPAVDAAGLGRFSFFVTSLRALQELSGSQSGFGGDLRFGETGPGAGLRGADRICAAIAERSMPGSSAKQWRAFLSVTNGGDGTPVHAINRIGTGPWYDRLGRLFGNSVADILTERPTSADPAIRNDFPNEDGVPNHAPDPTMGQVDNHDMLTGSNTQGRLYSNTGTCLDWTSALGTPATEGRPRVGHSWPRGMGGPGPGPGGGSMNNWMSSLDEAGCRAGVSLIEMGPPIASNPTVGSGGGYGGFYCFALTP
ncbi:MAG: hypothetical protein U0326_18880 [Polyangiales bacterium]